MRKYVVLGSAALAFAGCESVPIAPTTAPVAAVAKPLQNSPNQTSRAGPNASAVISAAAFQPAPAPVAVVPADTPLTLEGLEQLALAHNPTLAQAGANVEDARGRATQSGLYPNPTVGYTGEQIGLRGDAAPGEQQGAFIDQTIVTAGKLRLNRAKFGQEVTQMEWQAAAQQYRVVNGARVRYYQLLAMQKLVSVREELLKTAQDVVTTVEELVNVGQANKADLLQARIEARQAKVALQNAKALYQAARQQLAAFVGVQQLPDGPLPGDLEAGTPLPDQPTTLAHLLEASPELAIARAEVARNQFALQREQVEPIPNVQLRTATGYNFESKTVTTTVNAGVRLPVFDKNQGNVRSAQAQLAKSQAEVGRVELSLQRRLARAYARYLTALAVVETYRKDNLPDAREAYRLYKDSFEKRRAAYPQVLIAQRNYFQIATEYVEALEKLRRAEVEIRGLLLVDGTDEPPGPQGEGRLRRREGDGANPNDLPDPIPPSGRPLDDRTGNQPAGGE
jgi:outer membrane protein, heavy metal efflux system